MVDNPSLSGNFQGNPKMQGINLLLAKFLYITIFLVSYSSCLKMGETCNSGTKCDGGLVCGTCPANGNTRPRCIRIQPLSPTSKVKGLPFNQYSWLTTHNSYANAGAMSDTGSVILAPRNQEDSVTSQLQNGVRGLMLDMYDFDNDIWLCHSFGGRCLNVTAFGLTKVFNASGLSKFMFPLSRMPKNGGDWPTVDDMARQNQHLVVFTSKSSKEASEGIAYEWRYVVENQYGDEGMIAGSCPSRAESSPMNTSTISLVLQNYFHTDPNLTTTCVDNSAPLISMMNTCKKQLENDGQTSLLLITTKSDGGGAPEAVDEANGHLTCGCASIAYCKANATVGTCDTPRLSPPPPAGLTAAPRRRVPAMLQLLHWYNFIG